MKKTLLLFSVLSLSLANAQTITVDDTLSTGDVMYFYAADTAVTNYNSITGAGVTWDYSTLAYENVAGETTSKDTVIDITNSSYATNYPDADYHDQFNGGVQTFLSNTPDSIITHGFVFENGTNEYIIRYNVDPLKSAEFPMALGSSYTDLIDGDAVLPTVGTVALSGSATISADGTGTMLLGGMTYTDVIRVKTVENLAGTVPLVGAVSVTRTSYVYYSTSTSDMPIFIHGQIFADLGQAGTIDLKTVWSKDMLNGFAGVEEELSIQPELVVYPNPATTSLTIESNNATELRIYNAIGKEVIFIATPASTEQVDLSNLSTGIYFVQVKNGQQLITKKLVIK